MKISIIYKGNFQIFKAVNDLKIRWVEFVAGVWDLLLLTHSAAFLSILHTYTNVLKPFVTNVYFRQRQFSSSVLFPLLSCNIYNEFPANTNKIILK
jgi:hypothetical protein